MLFILQRFFHRLTDTGEVVRGKTSPETFYEYWVFIREDGRWVLDEIRQKDEVDVKRL